MGRHGGRQQEALRRARLRARERDVADVRTTPDAIRATMLADPSEVVLRRLASRTCAWCGGKIERKNRGRIPKWCSAACRQRAWVQRQAAAPDDDPVEVGERRADIPIGGPHPAAVPRHKEWVPLLDELARQIDTGAIYDRDLDVVVRAIDEVIASLRRTARRRH